jgi:hypothetical protein
MGNASVAVVDDRYSLFNNPAGLGFFKEHMELSISPLFLHLDKNFFDIAGFLLKNEKKLKDPNTYDQAFFNDFNEIDAKWAELGYLPEATFATRRFGFGMYNVLSTRISAETGHFIPKLGLGGNEDLVLTAAYAHRIKEIFSVGASFKYIYRVVLPDSILGFTDTYKFSKELQNSALGGNMGAFLDLGHLERGFGFDVGGMANVGEALRFGLAVQDLFEYLDGDFKHVRVGLGSAYRILPATRIPFIKDLIVAMDIKDIFLKDSFFNKLYMGTELDMHLAALRLGLNQGYPTFGFGLNFFIFHVDYAYLTEEAGFYPGQIPKSAHRFSLRLGFKF